MSGPQNALTGGRINELGSAIAFPEDPERVLVRATPEVLYGLVSLAHKVVSDDSGLDKGAGEHGKVVAIAELVELAGEAEELRDAGQQTDEGRIGKPVSGRVSIWVAQQREQGKV